MVSVALRSGLIDPGYTVTFTKTCKITKQPYSVTITAPQFAGWAGAGKHIQDVMPDLTPEQREFLMSGTTPAEWDDMFKENEAEQD